MSSLELIVCENNYHRLTLILKTTSKKKKEPIQLQIKESVPTWIKNSDGNIRCSFFLKGELLRANWNGLKAGSHKSTDDTVIVSIVQVILSVIGKSF